MLDREGRFPSAKTSQCLTGRADFIRGRGEERVFFARKCERPRQCCARVVVLEHERAYSLSAAFLGLVDVFGIMVEIAVSTAVDGLARSRGVDCQV